MTEISLFHFEEDRQCFEDLAIKNGANLWEQSDVMSALDYRSEEAFRKLVMKAMQACLTLGIPTEDNFHRQADGTYRFTRFACYLLAMNGDPKKLQVAAAQLYFAVLAETFHTALEHSDAIDRVLIRDEVSEGEKSLSSTASRHGVENYPFFQNAGYRGMYNMNLSKLRERKGLKPTEKLIDRMGKEELAAHLFRITQTAAKIRNEGVQGQRLLEDAAEKVGKQVRKSMLEISGAKPEDLPPAEPIKDVKKRLKQTDKQLRNIDKDGKKKP
ncbi:damage-inducible protein D [bacterium]|nr:damage-inducible protein D [bacterium]